MRTRVLSMRTYHPRPYTFGPLRAHGSELTLHVDRTRMLDNGSLRIFLALELSTDKGRTWCAWGEATMTGGSIIDTTPSTSWLRVPIPRVPHALVRGKITFSDVVQTAVDLDMSA